MVDGDEDVRLVGEKNFRDGCFGVDLFVHFPLYFLIHEVDVHDYSGIGVLGDRGAASAPLESDAFVYFVVKMAVVQVKS